MIGMNQIKKKLYTGIAIGVGIGVIIAVAVLAWAMLTIKSYNEGTNKKFNAEYTTLVCVPVVDIVQGQTITGDMLQTVRVYKATVPESAIGSIGEAEGTVARYNIAAFTPVTSLMLTDEILDVDIREQEINTVLMPSDLVEGQFIDVRIMFPNGTDYLVLAQKQVNKISGQTMWMNLKEDERLILSSAIVDSFLTQGTKLYATTYVDPSSQVKYELVDINIVKGELAKYIKDELPELAELGGSKVDVTTGETIGDGADAYADKIYDFIAKYNALTSSTAKTYTSYQPNMEVQSAMAINMNISSVAKDALSSDIRSGIEVLNNSYAQTNEDSMSNIVSGAQVSITEQQTERKNLLGEY